MTYVNVTPTTVNVTNSTLAPTVPLQAVHVTIADWAPVLFVGLLILSFNGMLCLAFATHKHLRQKSPNILICSQAAADAVNSLIFIPFHTLARYQIDGGSTSFTNCYILYLSLFSLLALSIDRYFLIVKPIYHRRFISLEKTKFIVLVIWVAPAVLSIIPLIWWFEEPAVMMKHQIRFVYSIWLIIVLSSFVMVGMYIYIFNFVKNYIKQKRESMKENPSHREQKLNEIALVKKELRVTRLFASLLFFFILAYAPIVYINIVELVGRLDLAPYFLIELSVYLFIGNSVANPILCVMLKKDYQEVILQMVGLKKNRVHTESSAAPAMRTQTQAPSTKEV